MRVGRKLKIEDRATSESFEAYVLHANPTDVFVLRTKQPLSKEETEQLNQSLRDMLASLAGGEEPSRALVIGGDVILGVAADVITVDSPTSAAVIEDAVKRAKAWGICDANAPIDVALARIVASWAKDQEKARAIAPKSSAAADARQNGEVS